MANSKSSLQKVNLKGHVATRTAVQPEGKIRVASVSTSTPLMGQQEYLDSIGIGHRPNSQRAITAWEEYQRIENRN
jgi:hypothetical protein